MSSCLSSGGGGRAYRLQTLDLDVIKSPSSTSWISNSSSPSSTLSETSNCPLAISTRKPRTPRKRPNQTYNEAAAILSTAYPKIFPTAAKPSRKFPNSHDHNANNSYSYNYSTTNTFMFEPSDQLLMPFQEVDTSRLLLDKPDFPIDIKVFDKPYQLSPPEIDSRGESHSSEEFDAESILDEEIGGGIESIMGNIELENVGFREPQPPANNTFCYGYPVPVGLGLRRESMAAMRSGDHCDWWRFQIPCVNVVDVTPSNGNEGKQKKKKVEMKKADAQAEAEAAGSDNSEDSGPQGLLLKLNYDAVLNAWSDKASPFSGDSPPSEAAGNDVRARLAQIDLFSDNGGVREASVLRYKEKRRTRLFSKKIRYQVRKVNADRRPRMKGRFVRTPTSSDD